MLLYELLQRAYLNQMLFYTSLISLIVGIGLFVFGSWGRFSKAGMRKYDEMAGMIPWFSFYVGIVVVVISLVLWAIWVYNRMSVE